jgi:hypothetical protein
MKLRRHVIDPRSRATATRVSETHRKRQRTFTAYSSETLEVLVRQPRRSGGTSWRRPSRATSCTPCRTGRRDQSVKTDWEVPVRARLGKWDLHARGRDRRLQSTTPEAAQIHGQDKCQALYQPLAPLQAANDTGGEAGYRAADCMYSCYVLTELRCFHSLYDHRELDPVPPPPPTPQQVLGRLPDSLRWHRVCSELPVSRGFHRQALFVRWLQAVRAWLNQ